MPHACSGEWHACITMASRTPYLSAYRICCVYTLIIQAEYVENLMKLQQLETLAAHGSDLAVIDGSAAVGLMAATSAKERERLKLAVALLEVKLGIPPGGRWVKSSPEFNEGLEKLKHHRVQRSRLKVAQLVVEVRQSREKTRRAGSTTASTKRHHKSERSKRRRINALLQEMYLWQCFGTARSPSSVALTEEQIKDMLKGSSPPWALPGLGADAAALRLYHGRMHHTACEDHTRLVEEDVCLRIEKRRLLRRLGIRVTQLRTALQAMGSGEQETLLAIEQQRQVLLVGGSSVTGCARHSLQDGMRLALAHHLVQARVALRIAACITAAIPELMGPLSG